MEQEKEVILKVEGVYKKFCLSLRRSMAYGTVDLTRNFLGIHYDAGVLRKGEFWALQDINFEVYKGDIVGIIGANGSGKSTLLRVLTGIFPPDAGKVTVDGKVGGLIAVGAGFHPHMTGRENIYLNGTILGMTREQIEEHFEEIINFAEIGDFIDAPVSTYSSGMQVRLGFSIAIHVQPEILLVDEVLSVGDLAFRNKSMRALSDVRDRAKGVIFISHNLEQVKSLCNRVIVINNGLKLYDGDPQGGIAMYEELSRDSSTRSMNKLYQSQFKVRRIADDGKTLVVNQLGIIDKEGNKAEKVGLNDPLVFETEFELKQEVSNLGFYANFGKIAGDEYLIHLSSHDYPDTRFDDLKPGKYRLRITIPDHHLVPGVYNVSIGFRNHKTFETYTKLYTDIAFTISTDGVALERGAINVQPQWDLVSTQS